MRVLAKDMHKKILDLLREHRKTEWEIIRHLIEFDRRRLWQDFGCTSLFDYALKKLDMTESIAVAFIGVARKTRTVPALREELRTQALSVSKASRVVSILTNENADEILEIARTKSKREIEIEIAIRNPEAARRDRVRPISKDKVRLEVTVSNFAEVERAQSLLCQRFGRHLTLSEVVEFLATDYVKRNDPVQKARRAKGRGAAKRVRLREVSAQEEVVETSIESASEPCPGKVDAGEVIPLAVKNMVYEKAGGRCEFHVKGERCAQDKWVEVHHIRPRSQGGTNDLGNLILLCGAHHDLLHQLELPGVLRDENGVFYDWRGKSTDG